MKRLILTSLIAFFILTTHVVKSQTVDEIKNIAMKYTTIQMNPAKFNACDPDYIYNRQSINRGYLDQEDRRIGLFGTDYLVHLNSEDDFNYYYSADGKLLAVQVVVEIGDKKLTFMYSYPSGRLGSFAVQVSPGDDYVFNPDGSLKVHWVGSKAYNVDGEVVGYR